MNKFTVPQSVFPEETPKLKAERIAEAKARHAELCKLAEGGYITEKNEPLKCTECESTNLGDVVTDTLDSYIMGYDRKCKDCGARLGSWDTGSWCW